MRAKVTKDRKSLAVKLELTFTNERELDFFLQTLQLGEAAYYGAQLGQDAAELREEINRASFKRARVGKG